MSSDLEEQADELLALASIYTDDVLAVHAPPGGASGDRGERGGTFQACVDLPDHVITVKSEAPSGLHIHGIKVCFGFV